MKKFVTATMMVATLVAGIAVTQPADAADPVLSRRVSKGSQKLKNQLHRRLFDDAVDAVRTGQGGLFEFDATTTRELSLMSDANVSAFQHALSGIRAGLCTTIEADQAGDACACSCASASDHKWECSPSGCSSKEGTDCD